MDTRAQSIGISRFILALIVGAIMVWIINLTTSPLLDRALNTTSNSTANQATTWFSEWIAFIPIAFVLISTMGLIVYAVFIREVGR